MPTGRFRTCQAGTPFLDAACNDVALYASSISKRLLLGCGSNTSSVAQISSNGFFAHTVTSCNVVFDSLAVRNASVASLSGLVYSGCNATFASLAASNAALSNCTCSNASIVTASVSSLSAGTTQSSNACAVMAGFSNLLSPAGTFSNLSASNLSVSALSAPGVTGSTFVFRSGSASVTVDVSGRALSADTALTIGSSLIVNSNAVIPNGRLGIGTATPAYPVDIRGTAYADTVTTPVAVAGTLSCGSLFFESNALPALGGVITSAGGNIGIYSGASNTGASISLGFRAGTYQSALVVQPTGVTMCNALTVPSVLATALQTGTLSIGATTLSNSAGYLGVSRDFAVASGNRSLTLSCPASGNASLYSVNTAMQLGPPSSPAITIGADGTLTFVKPLAMAVAQPIAIGSQSISSTASALVYTVTSAGSHIFEGAGSTYAQLSRNASARGNCLQFPNEAAPGARVVLWQDGDVNAYGGLGKETGYVVLRAPPSQDIVFAGGNGSAGTEYGRFSSAGTFSVNSGGSSTVGRVYVRSTVDEQGLVLDNKVFGANNAALSLRAITNTTRARPPIEFRVNNLVVGSVSHPTATTTAFNTTSDYRVKTDVTPMEERDSTRIVRDLRPVTFSFCNDATRHAGFIAHEVASVVPHVVTGEKDDPFSLQQIDHSKLIPYLVSFVQSLEKRLQALEKRL